MKVINLCILFLLMLPIVFAEIDVIETEIKVIVVDGGNSTCGNFTIETEDWDKTFVSNVTDDETLEIDLVRDVQCQSDRRFENMTAVCMDLSSQYQTILPQFDYITKYTDCNGAIHGAVELRDLYKKEKDELKTQLDLCVGERSAFETNYKNCQNEKALLYTEEKCKEKFPSNELMYGLIGLAIGYGVWVELPKRKKKDAERDNIEDVRGIDEL